MEGNCTKESRDAQTTSNMVDKTVMFCAKKIIDISYAFNYLNSSITCYNC